MKMIENYISNVKHYLPDDIKEDITEELANSLYEQIEDKQQALGRKLDQQEQSQLLKSMGHPMRIAAAYLPNQELVSKDYFPAYKRALEYALAIVIGISILTALPHIFTDRSVIGSLFSALFNALDTVLYVFAWITIVFYLLQKWQVGLDSIYAWSPENLKSKSSKLSINRFEMLFEIVIYSLFLSWWNDLVSWPSDILFENNLLPVSLSSEWQSIWLIVNIVVAASIILNVYKLIIAGWSKISLITDIALNLVSLGIIIQIALFDQYIVLQADKLTDINAVELESMLNSVVYSIIGFIALVCIWELYSNLNKIKQT